MKFLSNLFKTITMSIGILFELICLSIGVFYLVDNKTINEAYKNFYSQVQNINKDINNALDKIKNINVQETIEKLPELTKKINDEINQIKNSGNLSQEQIGSLEKLEITIKDLEKITNEINSNDISNIQDHLTKVETIIKDTQNVIDKIEPQKIEPIFKNTAIILTSTGGSLLGGTILFSCLYYCISKKKTKKN